MSKISTNLLVKGASGKMADQFVYKTRGSDTFLAKLPTVNKNRVVTEKQQEVRERFTEACVYAQGAIANPELKEAYQRRLLPGKTAYNAAFKDYLTPPEVKSIDARLYYGQVGGTIQVKAYDDFRVTEVEVSIRTATGSLVEEGKAVIDPINRNKWSYTTVAANPELAGTSISVLARDVPGNDARALIVL